MKKKLFGAAVAAAGAVVAMPVAASAATDSAATASIRTAPAPTASPAKATANTAYSQITHFTCRRINGVPYVGAQSRQSKYTTNTYYMSQTHTVQGLSGGRWVNLGSKKFYVNNPAGGVWYYAPSTTGDLLWNLTGWRGTFRVKVGFQWKTTSGSVYKATSTTPTCTK
jgi:hypothetical protein